MKRFLIITCLTIFCSGGSFAQSDSVHFAVQIGAWRDLPVEVSLYLQDKEHTIQLRGIDDDSPVHQVFVGNFACLEEGEHIQKMARQDGYNNAFITGWINNKRVSVREAQIAAGCGAER